ncbi:MAG: DUF4301 family protein, partial [Muribaculaceae bacterium]|nr:DUF4301 family protein [Muribaculaceae bacterium]
MLTTDDKELLAKRGISEKQLKDQLDRFKTGFPYLKIYDSARPGEGITVLDKAGEEAAVNRWDSFLADGGTVTKFVPASGAASRMFKALFSFVDSEAEKAEEGSDVDRLLNGIHDVAFFGELNAICERIHGKSVDQLLAEGKQKEVIAAIIKEDGMNYGNLPKGLLTFHHADEGTRTPVEEQLVEGAQSARQADGAVNMHLTVSGSHRSGFEKKLAEAVPAIEKRMG